MTLRALWTYDHVANVTPITVTSVAAYAAGNAYNQLTGNPGTPILRAGSSNAVVNSSTSAVSPGYLNFASNSAACAQGLVVALGDIPLLQGGITQAYFGFRTISAIIPLPNTLGVVGIAATATAAPTPLVTEAQLNRTVNLPNFVELFLDIGNNVYSAWIDGIKIINQAALPTGWSYLVFGNNTAQSNTGGFGFRDFYFVDVDGTVPNTRLGAIQSQLVPATAVTAPNYTSSDSKTPLVDLTTAYSGAPSAAPTITNAATNDPITAQFTSSLTGTPNILAMQYKMAASVVNAAKLTVQLSNGQTSVNPPAYVFPDLTMDYGRDLAGIQLTDPSGNKWTPSGIGATQLVVTPQSLT